MRITFVLSGAKRTVNVNTDPLLGGDSSLNGGDVEQSNFHDYRVIRMSEVAVLATAHRSAKASRRVALVTVTRLAREAAPSLPTWQPPHP